MMANNKAETGAGMVECDDDDEENDSDYVPEDDDQGSTAGRKGKKRKRELDAEEGQDGGALTEGFQSAARRRKVNSLWEEIQGSDRAYVTAMMAKVMATRSKATRVVMERPVRKKPWQQREFRALLRSLFGRHHPLLQRRDDDDVADDEDDEDLVPEGEAPQIEETGDAVDLRRAALESVQRLQRKTKVVETRKFAGQEVT